MRLHHPTLPTLGCCLQALVTDDQEDEAFVQLQVPLSGHSPAIVPPMMQPLVVVGPFGCGKRAVLQQLLGRLQGAAQAVAPLTTRPRPEDAPHGEHPQSPNAPPFTPPQPASNCVTPVNAPPPFSPFPPTFPPYISPSLQTWRWWTRPRCQPCRQPASCWCASACWTTATASARQLCGSCRRLGSCRCWTWTWWKMPWR